MWKAWKWLLFGRERIRETDKEEQTEREKRHKLKERKKSGGG